MAGADDILRRESIRIRGSINQIKKPQAWSVNATVQMWKYSQLLKVQNKQTYRHAPETIEPNVDQQFEQIIEVRRNQSGFVSTYIYFLPSISPALLRGQPFLLGILLTIFHF